MLFFKVSRGLATGKILWLQGTVGEGGLSRALLLSSRPKQVAVCSVGEHEIEVWVVLVIRFCRLYQRFTAYRFKRLAKLRFYLFLCLLCLDNGLRFLLNGLAVMCNASKISVFFV